ncbi:MAG: hypothetical protein CME65_07100 [Halobacteriovoraceae bacterium]|nr:hypothetical protein [Halobacteriovoraceae bacterium]
MTKLLTTLLFFSTLASANIKLAPPNFNLGDQRAVFVDFKHAQYDILFDTKNQQASVSATIRFEQLEEGYPLFDSVEDPFSVKLNGELISQRLISVPGGVSYMRMVDRKLPPGNYTLEVTSPITKRTRFTRKKDDWHRVSSAFFIRDLKDRLLLEQYLPTNYEYDNYKMEIDVKVTGTKRWHSLFTNGKMTKITNNHYKVSYPEFYTSSALYFHLVPIDKFVRYYLKYKSIDGREIPVTIYSRFRFYNYFAEKKARRVFRELEKDYGPYPYDQMIIYGTGIKGGMEYAGATDTSIVALGHELHHFYFAKGVFPANGNSGWMDEAIASWRDKGYQTHERPFYDSINLARHNVYTRKTDNRSYEYGRSFLAYIDYQLKEIGKPGLKDFLRGYFQKRKYTSVRTEDFKSDLEEYAQMSFSEDFFQYIYGSVGSPEDKSYDEHYHSEELNIFHAQRTEEELDSIL